MRLVRCIRLEVSIWRTTKQVSCPVWIRNDGMAGLTWGAWRNEVSAAITSLLGDFGISPNRIYVSCFDVPRENMMYNGATFAG